MPKKPDAVDKIQRKGNLNEKDLSKIFDLLYPDNEKFVAYFRGTAKRWFINGYKEALKKEGRFNDGSPEVFKYPRSRKQ